MFEEGPAGPAYTYQGMLRGRVKGGEREDWGGNREEEGQKEVPAPRAGAGQCICWDEPCA